MMLCQNVVVSDHVLLVIATFHYLNLAPDKLEMYFVAIYLY